MNTGECDTHTDQIFKMRSRYCLLLLDFLTDTFFSFVLWLYTNNKYMGERLRNGNAVEYAFCILFIAKCLIPFQIKYKTYFKISF